MSGLQVNTHAVRYLIYSISSECFTSKYTVRYLLHNSEWFASKYTVATFPAHQWCQNIVLNTMWYLYAIVCHLQGEQSFAWKLHKNEALYFVRWSGNGCLKEPVQLCACTALWQISQYSNNNIKLPAVYRTSYSNDYMISYVIICIFWYNNIMIYIYMPCSGEHQNSRQN